MAVFKLGSFGAEAVILKVPLSVPMSDLVTGMFCPFQVTRFTEDGATTSRVVVALR